MMLSSKSSLSVFTTASEGGNGLRCALCSVVVIEIPVYKTLRTQEVLFAKIEYLNYQFTTTSLFVNYNLTWFCN